MEQSVAQKTLPEQFRFDAGTAIIKLLPSLLLVLEARFQTLEVLDAKVDASLSSLENIALSRLNDTFTPLIIAAQERLDNFGATFSATSNTSLTVGPLGATKVLTIVEADREGFIYSDYIALRATDNLDVTMLCSVQSYDRESGQLALTVATLAGAGTHAGWQVRISAAPDLAHAARVDNPHLTTAAQVGAYTTAAADASVAAQITAAVNTINTAIAGFGFMRQSLNLSDLIDKNAARLNLNAAFALGGYTALNKAGDTCTGNFGVTGIETVQGELRTSSNILRLTADLARYISWSGGQNYSLGGAGTIWHTGNFTPASKADVGGNVTMFVNNAGYLSAGANISNFVNNANYAQRTDGVSEFANDAQYVSVGANISLFANSANYVSAGANISVFTNNLNYTRVGSNISQFINDNQYVSVGANVSNFVNNLDYAQRSDGVSEFNNDAHYVTKDNGVFDSAVDSGGNYYYFGHNAGIYLRWNGSGLETSHGLLVGGNLSCTGSKLFDIPHPNKTGLRLRHAALEGPESAVFQRGKAVIPASGEIRIKLPEYFSALCKPDSATISLQRIGKQSGICNLTADEVEGNSFMVYGDPLTRFHWRLEAERKGAEFEVEGKAPPALSAPTQINPAQGAPTDGN
jgi:hypothetical protein